MNTEKNHTEYWIDPIIDYLTGNIPEEENSRLQSWIAESEENRSYFEEIQSLWHSFEISSDNTTYDSQQAFLQFRERINLQSIPGEPSLLTAKRKNKRWWYAAAILIPFLFLSYFTILYFSGQSIKQPYAVSEVTAPYGSKTQIKLQDGTSVWLNAGSTITYDTDFGQKEREIHLSGEAYLEVAHDRNKPFIVSVGDMKVKVLGTRFNVNNYQGNPEIKVALLEGSVELLTSQHSPVVLSPDEVASYNLTTRQTSVQQQKDNHCIDWIENKLVFEGETFEQIAHTLERNFNVKINISKESIRNRQFVGDFVKNETIEQIFSVISTDGKFDYKINGNNIDVY